MTLALLVLVGLAVWLGVLYVNPFAECSRCHGRRTVMRGSKRRPRPVTCPACNGLGRRQRRGSRTVHQLARRVRRELARKRKTRATLAAPKGN